MDGQAPTRRCTFGQEDRVPPLHLDADRPDRHVTVGAYIARQGEPWWHTLGFVVLTVLIAGLPFIAVVAMGRRAESMLPKLRDWMNANSWIVNEAVLFFFLAMSTF